MTKTPLRSARLQLARIWFPAAGILFLILVVQSLTLVHGDEVQQVFSWALPNFLPTISLMMSVFAQDALVRDEQEIDKVFVRSSFLKISKWISLFYVALLFISVFAASVTGDRPLDTLEVSSIFLGPIQGLVVGALGVLFFVREEQK
ncbi:MAG: hypothetical protein AAF376_01755 [Pseudomonadota bacterium]